MGDPLQIEVISRLERLEARMRVVENISSSPQTAPPYGPALSGSAAAEVERLVREQAAELDKLQQRLAKAETEITEVAATGKELVLHGGGLPAKADQNLEEEIDARIDDMRLQIEEDLAKLNRRTMATIESFVDGKISERVLPIEKVVRAQAKALDDVRERATALEGHMQKLVTAVERMLERSASQPARAHESGEHQPFRTYLDHAISNEPLPPPPEVDPMFRPHIIKDEENSEGFTARRRKLAPQI